MLSCGVRRSLTLAEREEISRVRNNLTGYTLVRAESHEAAAALFLDHPHFSIFPCDAVEVMEVLPVPGAR